MIRTQWDWNISFVMCLTLYLWPFGRPLWWSLVYFYSHILKVQLSLFSLDNIGGWSLSVFRDFSDFWMLNEKQLTMQMNMVSLLTTNTTNTKLWIFIHVLAFKESFNIFPCSFSRVNRSAIMLSWKENESM